MKKNIKLWFVIAGILICIGCSIFIVVMLSLKWDFKKLSTVKYQTNYYEIEEDFKNININVKTADVIFVASEDEKCLITAFEDVEGVKTTRVESGTLIIEREVNAKWYENFNINFYTPTITISIPAGKYENLTIKKSTGDLFLPKEFAFNSIDVAGSTGDVSCLSQATESIKIKQSTGDIFIDNVTLKSCDLFVSTGKITVKSLVCEENVNLGSSTGDIQLIDITCKNLFSSANTGHISLTNVIATEKLNIKRTTGDVYFDGCDASEIHVETDTGDVTGTLLSDKIFITNTSTGRVDIPKTVNGGKCEIITSTGGIVIKIK